MYKSKIINRAIKCVVLVVFIFQYACRNSSNIRFDFDSYQVLYEYEDILTDRFAIERNITITNDRNRDEIRFRLLPDIEKLDDTRFFLVDSIIVERKRYGKTLIIEDPFAYALVDLDNCRIIYNSHGLDEIIEETAFMSDKICIGKIKKFTYSPNVCNIEF
jgi:hypothetical protein